MSEDRSVTRLSQSMHGSGAMLNTQPMVARLIPTSDISPDPKQPRRVIPLAVREAWFSGQNLFDAWLIYLGDAADGILRSTIETGEVDESAFSPVGLALLTVAKLAHSIHSHGLENPITVVGKEQPFTIETGERRWLAYVLLEYLNYGDQWKRIPAFRVDQFDIWRQAAENGARQDLNAVGRARQFALLVMAVSPNAAIKPYHECRSDLEFYAQVNKISTYGKSQQIGNAMGVNSTQLARYARMLKDAKESAWQQADVENWSMAQFFTAVKNSPQKPAESATNQHLLHRKYRTQFDRLWTSVKVGKPDKNAIAELRQWLDLIEGRG